MTKVFWSWQSDRPGKTGRHFVRKALQEAIDAILDSSDLEESQRDLHLDHDRKGAPGSPDLARLILDKVRQSAIFVADVTNVGRSDETSVVTAPKSLMNPNVAIELGYALATVGDAGLLMVMNQAYGGRETLPFDLSHKAGPIFYNLKPSASSAEIEAAKKGLTRLLKEAIIAYVEAFPTEVPAALLPKPFVPALSKSGPARFRAPNEPIGRRWERLPFGAGSERPVYLEDGPAMWLRVMPVTDVGKQWTAPELDNIAIQTGNLNLAPLVEGAGICRLIAEDGIGIFNSIPDEAAKTVSVAFAFETGEIWAVDTSLFSYDTLGLYISEIERVLPERLNDYVRFLSRLGLDPPYRWIAGVSGVKDRRLQVPMPPGQMRVAGWKGPLCLSDTIQREGDYDGEEAPTAALRPFFDLIYAKCGTKAPSYGPP